MEKEYKQIARVIENNNKWLNEVNQIRAGLAPLVETQNEKFDKLQEGFSTLGYIDLNEKGPSEPLTKSKTALLINKELEQLNEYLKAIYAEGRKDLIEPCERSIIELYKLIEHRWSTIIGTFLLRQKKLNEISNTRAKIFHEANEVSEELFEGVLERQYPLLVTLNTLETALVRESESLAQELFILYDLRDKHFNQSSDLFIQQSHSVIGIL